MNIKPIRTPGEHKDALSKMALYIENPPKRGTHEADYYELLGLVIEDYERKTFSLESPTPVQAIQFRLEQLGLERSALIPVMGTRARVSEILNEKRPLTLAMIRKLHKQFNIPLESLIGSTDEDE